MTTHLEALEVEVLSLSPADRERLLDKLVASLDADPAVEDAWRAEAKRRDDEIESGSVQTLPVDQVLSDLRSTLR